MNNVSILLPIKTVSESNSRDSWQKRFFTRTKPQRRDACLLLRGKVGSPPSPPLLIRLTRVAPGRLDRQNMGSALKAVIDGVADWLGMDDGDPRLDWVFAQEKPVKGAVLRYAVRVEIEPSKGAVIRG